LDPHVLTTKNLDAETDVAILTAITDESTDEKHAIQSNKIRCNQCKD